MTPDGHQPGGFGESARFGRPYVRFDEENSRDPNCEMVEDVAHPRELLYAQRLSEWVLKLCPSVESLRLAARCQHLCRWMIPRTTIPWTAQAISAGEMT